MKHYVLGFIFNRSQDKVLLVEKKRPLWQTDKWNGVGGKIEDKDINPLEAMQREGREETGMTLNWLHRITFICRGGTIFVYKAIDNLNCGHEEFCNEIHYKQIENEILKEWQINNLPDVIPNLKWLISVCLSTIQFPILLHEDDIVKQWKDVHHIHHQENLYYYKNFEK